MKTITIKNTKGVGILTLATDGKWDIELNGKQGGSLHYTQEQVDQIVARAKSDGSEVTISN